jgi:hypothetical protein
MINAPPSTQPQLPGPHANILGSHPSLRLWPCEWNTLTTTQCGSAVNPATHHMNSWPCCQPSAMSYIHTQYGLDTPSVVGVDNTRLPVGICFRCQSAC